MQLFLMYVLFALTTAIVALYELFWPIKNLVSERHEIKEWFFSNIAFFCIAMLIAPIVLIPCLVPSIGQRFREALVKELETPLEN